MFEAQTGDVDLQQQDVTEQGEYFINSGVQNCGIKGRTNRQAKIFPANTLTVDFLGNVYYRPFEYKMATHNHVFSLSSDIIRNELVGLYIVSQMSYLKRVYSFNNMGTWPRIKKHTIRLPITKNDEIDFVYIENYMCELEKEHIRELEVFFQDAGFEDCSLSEEERKALLSIERKEKQMQKFAIVKAFNVANTHNILKSDVAFGSGTTPYVTASEGNNSIVSYISYKPDMMEKGNSIVIGGKTLVITYQPRDFYSNDSHNLVLKVCDEEGRNESAQLFMVAALYKTLGPKYSWGDSISNAKIQKDMVLLPVKDDGESIDYVFMETYINAIKKQYIANLKSEIKKHIADSQIKVEYSEGSIVEANIIENFNHDSSDLWMAAESFECYKWDRLDQSVCDFFGGDKTILVGCYKGKKHLEWILSHQMYNIRLGKTKGLMEANRKLFESTSILVLYELEKQNKLLAFRVTGHQEMGKEELVALGYPNENPRKNYMTFSFTPLDVDLSSLADQHLIDRLIELNPDVIKGTPVFIEP